MKYGFGSISISLLMLVTVISAEGEINIYFNKSVNQNYAYSGNQAAGSVNMAQVVYDHINAAQYSIDMAVYSFNLNYAPYPLSTALVNAYNRGVIIRVVLDYEYSSTGVTLLTNAGIPVIRRTNGNGLMHNKFYIFDARDSIPGNDWLITGSWNATTDQTYTDCQNMLEIQDSALAAAYTTEFQEMWGSTGNYPNTANARFGSSKTNNTPHTFIIDGIPVELYFSPSDGTTSHIIEQIQGANSKAILGLMVFTRYDIANALYQRSIAGADVIGIIDDINTTGSQWSYLNTFADMYDWNAGGIFHHKYAFIDYDSPGSVPTLITGSHNWSNAAENNNDENTLIIKSDWIVNQYAQEFAARIAQLGGTLPMPLLEVIDDVTISFDQDNVWLEWTPAQGATGYKVYASDNPYSPVNEWILLGTTAFPWFSDDGGIYDGVKFYRVTVYN